MDVTVAVAVIVIVGIIMGLSSDIFVAAFDFDSVKYPNDILASL